MTYPYPNLNRGRIAEVLGAAVPQRDVTWGRILFRPPELANPRLIFDPLPFRTHEFVPAKNVPARERA